MRNFLLGCFALFSTGLFAQFSMDAAVAIDDDYICFFKDDRVVLFSNNENKVINVGSLEEAFPGTGFNKIDAAINYNDEYIYFFSGSEYTRIDKSTMMADEGYPANTAENWSGIDYESIDAAFSWSNGKSYFFNGGEYLRYDRNTETTDEGYPKMIDSKTWPGITFGAIDAAYTLSNGKTYFFKGEQYIRFDNAADKADEGYPKNLSTFNGLKDALAGKAPNPQPEPAPTAAGIEFFKGTWKEALAAAKAQNKLIFMDAYASWCGPCKWMAANSFTDKAVGEFFNKNFINVKMDMEKGEGPGLAKTYPLNAYPTLFFIDGSGNLVKTSVGALDAAALLTAGKEATAPKPQPQPQPAPATAGIEFFKGSWKEALAAAKSQNKLIFMDAYASWCGPCKWMAANSFTDKAVGEFFNKNFINVKMDMEKGEGPGLAKTYPLNAYPTLFFIDGSGKLVKTSVGALDAAALLSLGKEVKK